jgi:hypothetical protein
MTHKQIMAWGEKNRYLFLQIGKEDNPPTQEVLRHGKEHYEALRHDARRRRLTSLRIERFPARLTRVQVTEAIERVDEALSKQTKQQVQMEERIQV